MQTTKLSSKGQVIIPKALRASHQWQAGMELLAINTEDGILLKPKAPFPATELASVVGMLKHITRPQSAADIEMALQRDVRKKWRDHD